MKKMLFLKRLHRPGRKKKPFTWVLGGRPQRSGIVEQAVVRSPKKPHSGGRPTAKVKMRINMKNYKTRRKERLLHRHRLYERLLYIGLPGQSMRDCVKKI